MHAGSGDGGVNCVGTGTSSSEYGSLSFSAGDWDRSKGFADDEPGEDLLGLGSSGEDLFGLGSSGDDSPLRF